MVENGRFHASGPAVGSLQLPPILPLVVDQPRIIVSFVEVFEDGGEDLGFFVGEVDLLVLGFQELASTGSLKERRKAEYVFVCSKEPLFSTNDEGDD